MVEHTIVVLGRIDASKTTFIKAVRNAFEGIPGSHNTEEPTLDIMEYDVTLPDGRSLTFLDTPGFDGYHPGGERAKETEEILQMVEEHLAAKGRSVPVSHVLVLAGADGMATTELKGRARRTFERLFSNTQIVCVTTRWDQIEDDIGASITAQEAESKEESLYADGRTSGSLLEYLQDGRLNRGGDVLRFRSGLPTEAYSSPRDIMLKLFAGPASDGTLEERLAAVTKERDELAAKYDLLLKEKQAPTTANDAAPPAVRTPRTRRQRLLDTIDNFSAQVALLIDELEREGLDVVDEWAADRAACEAASSAIQEAEGRLAESTERVKVVERERANLARERDALRELELSLTAQLDELGAEAGQPALGAFPSVNQRLSSRLEHTQVLLSDMEGWISTAEEFHQNGRQKVEQAAAEIETWDHIKRGREGELNEWLSLEYGRIMEDQKNFRELQAALCTNLDDMREGLKDSWDGKLRDNRVFWERLDDYTINPEIVAHPGVWAPVIESFYETRVVLSLMQKMAGFHSAVVQRLKVREDMVEREWKKGVEGIFLPKLKDLPPPPPPLAGHSQPVRAVSFSPDGMKIVSGSLDTTVRVWDALTGKVQSVFDGHGDKVLSVAFSPSGEHIISGSGDKSVRVWDVLTGRVKKVLAGHTSSVWSVGFSADGSRIVSGSVDKTVRIWDTSTGQIQRILEGHTKTVYSVAFWEGGSKVISGSDDKTARVWNALTGTVQATLNVGSSVGSVAVSADELWLVTGSLDGLVKVWDALTGKVLKVLKGHTSSARSVALSRDKSWIVSGSFDDTLRVWDASTGAVRSVRAEHTGDVNAVALSRDGRRVASASDDETIRVWDMASLTSTA